MEKMQFARLVAESGEGPEKPKELNAFIEDLKTEDWDSLGPDYPSAYEEIQERKVSGESLPNLKIHLSSPSTSRGFDPINPTNRKY